MLAEKLSQLNLLPLSFCVYKALILFVQVFF